MPVVTPQDLARLHTPPPQIPAGIKSASADNNRIDRIVYAAGSVILIVVVCVLALIWVKDPDFSTRPRPTAPVEGLTIFAVFFVAALAVERLLEPFEGLLLSKAEKTTEADEKSSAAAEKIAAVTAQGIMGEAGEKETAAANNAVQAVAKAEAELSDRVWARTIVYWAVASSIGIYVSAVMKLYLLRSIGISDAARWQEVLATGLIIGAGTKPLHDLTKLITAQKEAKQTTT